MTSRDAFTLNCLVVFLSLQATIRKGPRRFSQLSQLGAAAAAFLIEPDWDDSNHLFQTTWVQAALQSKSKVISPRHSPLTEDGGIRATIDVVSVDLLSGDYGTFKEKLDGLVNEGHFTRSQQGTFIAVVEAGNAASHRGFIPDRESVMGMLQAIQHMLVSAYVLLGSAKSLLASTPKRPPKLRG